MTELERWLADYARDTVVEWLRRPGTPPITEGGDETSQYRLAWLVDGSVVLERDGRAWLRFEMEISFKAVEGNRPDEDMPITERAWGQIPAGWFVQHPTDGSWWEIASTSRMEDGRQEVTFKPSGRSLRPAEGLVACRPGTDPSEAGKALRAAMSVFEGTFPRVEIIEDQIS